MNLLQIVPASRRAVKSTNAARYARICRRSYKCFNSVSAGPPYSLMLDEEYAGVVSFGLACDLLSMLPSQ